MLWTALLGEEVVLDEEPPELVDDKRARLEELAEVPRLGRRGSDGLGRPVLDVPGGSLKVGRASVVVLVVIAVVVAAVVLDYRVSWWPW
jgi:hypothetical protein